jgi:hypothetical protein
MHGDPSAAVELVLQQLRQLGNIRGDAPGLVARINLVAARRPGSSSK